MTKIIGINSFYHNSSAALFIDNKVKNAIAEERLSRIKHDANFPINSLDLLLNFNNLSPNDIDLICYYERPDLKFERVINSLVSNSDASNLSQHYAKRYAPEHEIQAYFGAKIPIKYFHHHQSHLAHSFYSSHFEECSFLICDAVGEKNCTSFGHYDQNKNYIYDTIDFPHSIGMLYSTITEFLGFYVNQDEYKVMGLAAFGQPKYYEKLKQLYDFSQNQLNLTYFQFQHYNHSHTFSETLKDLLGLTPRGLNQEITSQHRDLAASIQLLFEEILLLLVEQVFKKYPHKNLCLGGGAFMNSVANAKIHSQGLFKNIHVPFAATDAGSAIGCAILGALELDIKPKRHFSPFLAPTHKNEIITTSFDEYLYPLDLNLISKALVEGKTIGVYCQASEFGERALGNRSIIANANFQGMQKKLNSLIKRREDFRPFAPVILEPFFEEYFDGFKCPYMTTVCNAKKIALENIPEAIHIDQTARVQTLSDSNHLLYKIIFHFYKQTNIPAVINTSFNLKDEPIVESYVDALKCFIRSGLDILILNDMMILKEDIPINYKEVLENSFKYYNQPSRNTYSF